MSVGPFILAFSAPTLKTYIKKDYSKVNQDTNLFLATIPLSSHCYTIVDWQNQLNNEFKRELTLPFSNHIILVFQI